MQPYSPERRTALLLCGTGAHGAYHAGVLRALQEAGVKIDVMAGQGVGAGAAAVAAIDGASRLWEADGVWSPAQARRFYRWKWPLRAAAWLSLVVATLVVAALLAAVLGLSATPLLVAALILGLGTTVLLWCGERGQGARRRAAGPGIWRLLGAPCEVASVRAAFRAVLGDRYADVLNESLGQPGFRELMIVATDLDAHRDVVGALLREPYRREFTAPRPGIERRAEAFDLSAAGAEHTGDLVAAALTPPVLCDPCLMKFGVESYWRGETHRMCDRPGAILRLLDELASVGVSQAIIVSGVSAPGAPHRLRATRLEPRQRAADFLAAAESSAMRDAMEMARLRFDSVYLIAPAHNPVGAFDFEGAYDEASDRRQDLDEVMTRAYEDAYHQFIEPVVGASGERLGRADARVAGLPR